jgi:hypothetical protein
MDILMTHAGPYCSELLCGSKHLTQLAKRVKPTVHLFGHHHQIIQPCEGSGGSLLIGLEHLNFNSDDQIRKRSWGILTLSKNKPTFIFASQKNTRFLKNVQRNNYRLLLKNENN